MALMTPMITREGEKTIKMRVMKNGGMTSGTENVTEIGTVKKTETGNLNTGIASYLSSTVK